MPQSYPQRLKRKLHAFTKKRTVPTKVSRIVETYLTLSLASKIKAPNHRRLVRINICRDQDLDRRASIKNAF